MLEATGMDFQRRATERSRFEKVTNEIMQVKHMIEDEIKNGKLIWYGYVERMPETRIPKQIINYKPPEKEILEDQEKVCRKA